MALTDKIKNQSGTDVASVELTSDIEAGVAESSRLLKHLLAKYTPINGDMNSATKFRVLRGLLRKTMGGKAYDAKAKANALQDIRRTITAHESYFTLDQYIAIEPTTFSGTEIKNIGVSEAAMRAVFGTTVGSSLGIALDEYIFLNLLNVAKAKTNGITYAQDLSAKTDTEIVDLLFKDLVKLGVTVKFNSGANGKAVAETLRRSVDIAKVRGILPLTVALPIMKWLIANGIQAGWDKVQSEIVTLNFLGAQFEIYNDIALAFSVNWAMWVGDAFAGGMRANEDGVDFRKIGNDVYEMDAKATYGMYKEETNDYVVASVTLADSAAVPAVPANPVE